jgi:hypothetical protein
MDAMEQIQKINSNLYPNGTPFLYVEQLDKFLRDAIKEVNGKKPCVIVIGGAQSSAKTTLSIHLIDRINSMVGQQEMDLTNPDNPQYSQGSKNFMRKLNEAYKQGKRIIVWDETAADYRRKRSISNINKILDEAMDMIRKFKMIVILVYHDFSEIPTELIKKKVITCLFQNGDRDVDRNHVTSKLYNYGKMCIIKHNLIKSIIPEYAFRIDPNFTIIFKDLSPERSAQLEILSSNLKDKIFEKAEIALQGYVSREDISNKIGMSQDWVRKHIKKYGIEHTRKIGQVTYYENKVIEQLRQKIKRKN